MELVLGEGESSIIPTTTTMDRAQEREDARRSVDTGKNTLDVKDTTRNGAVDGTSVEDGFSSNETVSMTKNVPPTKMDSPRTVSSTTTKTSPLDVSSLTTNERLDEEPSPSKDPASNHAQSLPAAKNDPPRLPSDEPNHATVASTTNDSSSPNNSHSTSTIPSTDSTPIPPSTSTPPPTSQNAPPDVQNSPPDSDVPTNVDSSPSQPPIDAPTQPSIKIIDFGYAASSPLHRPLWAPPLDQHEEEELEEFDDDSDSDSDDEDGADEGEGDEEGEGEGEGEMDLELEPGLYRAVYAFEAEGASEVSLERGQVIRVVGRGGGVGWAVVLDEGGKEGKRRHALVPESYLVRVELEEGQE